MSEYRGQIAVTVNDDGTASASIGPLQLYVPPPPPPPPPSPPPAEWFPPEPLAPTFTELAAVASNAIVPASGRAYGNFSRKSDATGAVFRLETAGVIVEDVTIKNILFCNGALLFIRSGGFNRLAVRQVKGVGIQRAGIKIEHGLSNNLVFQDIDLTAFGRTTSGSYVPTGIVVDDAADNVLIERYRASGFGQIRGPGDYWNGDGITLQGAVTNAVLRDCWCYDNTDAGYDLKALGLKLEGICGAEENCRNWRFSGSFSAETLVSLNPRKLGGNTGLAHIWAKVTREDAVIQIGRLIARGQGPLFSIDQETNKKITVVVETHDIEGPTAAADPRIEYVWKSGAPA